MSICLGCEDNNNESNKIVPKYFIVHSLLIENCGFFSINTRNMSFSCFLHLNEKFAGCGFVLVSILAQSENRLKQVKIADIHVF